MLGRRRLLRLRVLLGLGVKSKLVSPLGVFELAQEILLSAALVGARLLELVSQPLVLLEKAALVILVAASVLLHFTASLSDCDLELAPSFVRGSKLCQMRLNILPHIFEDSGLLLKCDYLSC